MNIFKKCYTCDAIENGKLVGSIVGIFWFWKTPAGAIATLVKCLAKANPKACPANFRRIK